jgi:hypothetical protein
MIGELRIWKDAQGVPSEYRGKIFFVLCEETVVYDAALRRKHVKCMFEGKIMLWHPKFARQNSKKVK